MLVDRNWCQTEDLGANALLQVNHQAHHIGIELSYPDAGNIGIVLTNFGHQFPQRRVEAYTGDVQYNARRIGQYALAGLQGAVGLDSYARVVRCWPNAHIDDARAMH